MLQTNLISFWELEEASGTRIDRVVASGNDLTDNATVTQNPGKVGQAAQFTAANSESLSRASNSSLQIGDIDFTVCCWVYLDAKADNMRFLDKDDNTPAGGREYTIQYRFTTDRFEMFVFSATDVVAGNVVANTIGSPSTATWYFVLGWHDATSNTLNIQINDGTVDSVATSNPLQAAGGAEFRIGASAEFGAFMNGRIDQAGLWKRVLTASERTFLFNDGKGVSWQDILRYDAGAGDYQGFPKPKIREAVLHREM